MRAALDFVTATEGMAWLLACSIKVSLLLAASCAGAVILRRNTAASRHQIWTLGIAGALALPLLCWIVPSLLPAAEPTALATTGSITFSAVVTPATSSSAPTWPTWLAIAWALGASLVGIRLVRSHLAARRWVRTATPVVDDSWTITARDVARTLGLAADVPLLRSTAIESPMTIGIWQPRVVLPATADTWTALRLRAVLLHELGHVRRRDTQIQLAAGLACALYWWNPLAWIAAARLRIEREHACDDLVLGAGVLPSSYATDLLDVARSVSLHDRSTAVCMADRSSTETRLVRILDITTPRNPLGAPFRLAALGVALAVAGTLACTSDAPPVAPDSARVAVAPPSQPATRVSLGAPFLRDWDMTSPPGLDLSAQRANQGQLDLSLVSAEVQRRIATLEQCYDKRLAEKPALAGTVTVHWVIEPSGKVPDSCITEDTVQDPAIVDCVNELVLKGGTFPAPRGGSVDVFMPFVFAPRTVAAR